MSILETQDPISLEKRERDNLPQSRANDLNASAAASEDLFAELSQFSTTISKTSLAPLLHTMPKLKWVNVTIVKDADENIDVLYRSIFKTPTHSHTSETWSTPGSVFRLEIPSLGWVLSP